MPIHQKITSLVKNWWWSGLAFFLTILFIGGFIGGIIQNTHYTILERFAVSADILGLLALWGLGLQKRFFRQFFWQLFIFINALLFILYMVFGKKYEISLLWCIILYFATVIVYVPYYIGMFIYAFRAKQIWKEAEQHSIYKARKKRKQAQQMLGWLKLSATIVLIIICLTFIPLIISNNRIVIPYANPPEYNERMLKYRRTTIPELNEFESLFPNYLYQLTYEFEPDSTEKEKSAALFDPNTSVKWSLIAGLHKRYLFTMEIDIVHAKIEPETGKVLSPGSYKEPTFILYEVVGSVSVPFALFRPRSVSVSYKSIKIFDTNEWRHLVEAQGNFMALGIQLKQDSPIPNFKLAFRNNK